MNLKLIDGVYMPERPSFRRELIKALRNLEAGACLEIMINGRSAANLRNQVSLASSTVRETVPGFTVSTRIVDTPDGPALRVWRLENKSMI